MPQAASASRNKLQNTCNCHICGDFWERKVNNKCEKHWPTVSSFPCQCSMPYSELLNTFKGLGEWPPVRLGKPAKHARQEVNGWGCFLMTICFLETCLELVCGWEHHAVCPISGLSLLLLRVEEVRDKGRKAALVSAWLGSPFPRQVWSSIGARRGDPRLSRQEFCRMWGKGLFACDESCRSHAGCCCVWQQRWCKAGKGRRAEQKEMVTTAWCRQRWKVQGHTPGHTRAMHAACNKQSGEARTCKWLAVGGKGGNTRKASHVDS